jgi:hypothetical protein
MRTVLFFSATLLLAPLLVFAQDTTSTAFIPLTSIPGIESAGNANSLPDFLNNLYRLMIGAAAVLAVLQIVRAGIMYMGGDSITERKEAKNLIALAIGGLVLILSPVIVFSVINPDILSLKIGKLGELTKTEFDEYQPGAPITGAGGSGQCTPPYISIGRVAAVAGCNTEGGYEKIADTCCSNLGTGQICCGSKTTTPPVAPAATSPAACQSSNSLVQATNACGAGYVVADNACCSSVGSGKKCCGKPKTTQPAAVKWGWRGTVVPNSGGGQTTAQKGGLTTQKLCQDSITEYAQKNNVSFTGDFTCNCNTDLSKQTGCSTL